MREIYNQSCGCLCDLNMKKPPIFQEAWLTMGLMITIINLAARMGNL